MEVWGDDSLWAGLPALALACVGFTPVLGRMRPRVRQSP